MDVQKPKKKPIKQETEFRRKRSSRRMAKAPQKPKTPESPEIKTQPRQKPSRRPVKVPAGQTYSRTEKAPMRKGPARKANTEPAKKPRSGCWSYLLGSCVFLLIIDLILLGFAVFYIRQGVQILQEKDTGALVEYIEETIGPEGEAFLQSVVESVIGTDLQSSSSAVDEINSATDGALNDANSEEINRFIENSLNNVDEESSSTSNN